MHFLQLMRDNRDAEAQASSSSSSVGGADFEELALNLTEIKKKIQKLVNVLSFVLCFVVVATLLCIFK